MIYRMTALAVLSCWALLGPVHASTTAASSSTRPITTLVNINTADVATLAREIKGIGESKARAIVEHRQKNGAFRSVDELALVKGIGAKTLENNRGRLTVGSGGAAAKPSGVSSTAGAAGRSPTGQNVSKPSAGSR
jgi:competence protein ComEA